MKVHVSELIAIPRSKGRDAIGWKEPVPFQGSDIWNTYEFSFLRPDGKPTAGILTIEYDADSQNIVESKSLKLYLNSYSMKRFTSLEEVLHIIETDLGKTLGTKNLQLSYESNASFTNNFTDSSQFLCLDDIDIDDISEYTPNPELLKTAHAKSLDYYFSSHLLRSNCPITNQPDWGSVYLYYRADDKTLQPGSFVQYIISYRLHNEYHEECCERILYDLVHILEPDKLALICKYTRRGGIDINPLRIYPRETCLAEIPEEFTQLIYTRDFHQ
ncbi:MAG: 7-cyano-7-deazaguanine reductase [Candidatus Cloacimonetes bacterium]|nr:7-cyano-7-deazaguanine reductase [Candidatus Cloacimonadota bacterium]